MFLQRNPRVFLLSPFKVIVTRNKVLIDDFIAVQSGIVRFLVVNHFPCLNNREGVNGLLFFVCVLV